MKRKIRSREYGVKENGFATKKKKIHKYSVEELQSFRSFLAKKNPGSAVLEHVERRLKQAQSV